METKPQIHDLPSAAKSPLLDKKGREIKLTGCLWCGGGGHTGVTLVTVWQKRENQEPEKKYACARCLIEKTRPKEARNATPHNPSSISSEKNAS